MNQEYITGTYYLSQAGVSCTRVRSLIQRRRLQILVHSYIYYELNSNIVMDSIWDEWARELVLLQKRYPSISRSTPYAQAFRGFKGFTGVGLPYNNPEIAHKAKQILENIP